MYQKFLGLIDSYVVDEYGITMDLTTQKEDSI